MSNYYGIIYKVTNSLTNKVYIGQTIEPLEVRKNKHYYKAKLYKEKAKCSNHFLNALNKYPKEFFVWKIIDHAENQKKLDELEIYYIKKYNSIEKGYNIREGGLGREGGDSFAESCGSKPFVLYNSQGEFIGRFINKREVERKFHINHSDISQMVLNDKGFSHGYIAFNEEDFSEEKLKEKIIIYNKYRKKKSFIGIDDDGNTIGPFKTISEANKFLGLSSSHIGEVLSQKRQRAAGYHFKYMEDIDE